MAKLDYYNRSIKGTSYSRRLTLHSCPRKFELGAKFNVSSRTNSVTFAYGHAVAMGIQSTIAGASYHEAMIESIIAYDHDILDTGTENERRSKKSVWHVVQNVDLFWKQYNSGVFGYLDGWVVPDFKHPTTGEMIKAIELTYVLEIVDGFTDEGHIDLVLYHPVRKRYMIVEIKTTGAKNVDEASYKYSDQPLGYGIILDAIAAANDETASFDVLYLVYKSTAKQLVPMPFTKTVGDRARWFNQLLVDVQHIQQYEENGFYPHRGESCFSYFRPCEYFGSTCKLSQESLERLSAANTEANLDNQEFAQMMQPMFTFTIEQLLARQDELVNQLQQEIAIEAGIDSVDVLLATTVGGV